MTTGVDFHCCSVRTDRFLAAGHAGDPEHREPSLGFRDESTLHAKGLLLTLVGVDAGVKVEPAAVVLQVMDELMDGNMILGGVGQVLPEEDDVGIFVQSEDRAWNAVLARPMTEPALGFPLHVGKAIWKRIPGQLRGPRHDVQNPFLHGFPDCVDGDMRCALLIEQIGTMSKSVAVTGVWRVADPAASVTDETLLALPIRACAAYQGLVDALIFKSYIESGAFRLINGFV